MDCNLLPRKLLNLGQCSVITFYVFGGGEREREKGRQTERQGEGER
jgi:hypothetical protein